MTQPSSVHVDGAAVTISGEVDMANVDELSVAFDAARREQHGDITADVSAVDFIDASALRVLLDTHRYLRDDGRRLTLQSPSAAVLRLLRLAGLDGSLPMTGETGDARGSGRAYRA